ncbi:diacylglycerol kinase [Streptomyces sp. NPDC049906]|uniref:diacylglycerol kinase n=1 Tax=Streptomyces sp. NPDC049906 TaxID=3155656 RepID=UPI003439D6C2
MSVSDQLLLLVDPVARLHDGESVRIAKDVLSGGAGVKVCLPEHPGEFARSLARRGSRRPVVVGDDHALLRTVTLLHRERELESTALSLVPVGGEVSLARSLGVPAGTVGAARAVLEGTARRLDLLVDDADGVVLRALRVPHGDAPGPVVTGGGAGWLRSSWARVRGAVVPVPAGAVRVRVEVDGEVLVEPATPVAAVDVGPGGDGECEVVVRWAGAGARVVRARGRTVTVSGAGASGEGFRYRADAVAGGPVRRRTWTCRPKGWTLTLPAGM